MIDSQSNPKHAFDKDALNSINPATGILLEAFDYSSSEEVEAALDVAVSSQAAWRQTSLAERSLVLRRMSDELLAARSSIARDITLEMGKLIIEAEAEIDKCAWNCRYVADMAAEWLGDEPVATSASESYLSYLPLGVLLAVMPWNFPLWQLFRFAAPALMAGNGVLLKHAPNVTRCALDIVEIGERAGLPRGLLQAVFVPVAEVAGLIADPRVAAVTCTGSPAAGAAIAGLAGASLKKSVLELGGSDSFLVLADADLEGAVTAAVRGRFSNCGQICLAPKRFILEDSIAESFEEQFVAAVSLLRVGDPLDPQTQMGPMARADLLEELDAQVQRSIGQGARVLHGAQRLDRPGNFYSPTVLSGVTARMSVACEETFGPVAALMRARDVEHAIELANDSDYGLSSNIWTRDLTTAKRVARSIHAGGAFINAVSASDPRMPIGGVKRSGYGRELACVGIREFVNTQAVHIA